MNENKDRYILKKLLINFDNNWLKVFESGNSLKSNRSIVLEAVHQEGLILEYVDDSFKDDLEIVETALTNNGMAFVHVSTQLQS